MEEPEIIEEFYGVYLLYCLNEKYLGRTYIGYTVDPNRRINQHNKGVIAGGARRTNNKGPWKMLMIIHGFPNNIAALRFEWAWQNPEQSRRLIHVVNRKKMARKENQLQYRLRILSEMLRVGPWCRLPLTVRWLADDFVQEFSPDKSPPLHMPICHGPVKTKKITRTQDDGSGANTAEGEGKKRKRQTARDSRAKIDSRLNNERETGGHASSSQSCHVNANNGEIVNYKKDFCSLCYKEILSRDMLTCLNEECDLVSHICCLGELFLESGEYVPVEGDCPFCCKRLLWGDLVRKMKGCNDLADKLIASRDASEGDKNLDAIFGCDKLSDVSENDSNEEFVLELSDEE